MSFTTCLLLNSILGIKPTSIPFNGTGPALTALISGPGRLHVRPDRQCRAAGGERPDQGLCDRHAGAQPGPAERSTSKEAGLPEFQAQAWNALFAPKGTPQPVLDKLSDALDKALDDEQTRKRLLELGSVLPDKGGRGQQALAALVKSEIDRWTPIIKAAGPTN